MHVLYLVSICMFIHLAWSEESCQKDDGLCTKSGESIASERYSASANQAVGNPRFLHFLSQIKRARESYRSCNRTDCSCISSRLDKDLAPWRNGITDRGILKKAVARDRGVLYQVFNKKLYRSSECKFPSRCEGVEYFLRRILPQLPDLEFVLNDSDYPQVFDYNFQNEPTVPIFSFSKDQKHLDILYPAWSFWAGGPALNELFPQGLGRWDVWHNRLQHTASNWPWEKKEVKGFFRGSRTSNDRDFLILLSRKRPNLIDAAYTKNQAWKSDADTLGAPAAEDVGLEEHCKFRFLFNFRGVAASFRFRHLFLCRSTVFHVGEEWIEFFYDDLKPWVHFIPVSEKLSSDEMQKEISDLMEFALKNDDLMREIANNGASFIERNLEMKHVECYWRRLLRRYARLLRYKVTLDDTLKLVI